MNNNREITPLMTPDTIRAFTKFLKKFSDQHTKKYHGYEDIDGSKYVGTVENFGDEILIESRKLLMDKPSLKQMFRVNNLSKYFNIEFSDLTDTYTQQNMLVALLKHDSLKKYYSYSIKFEDCYKNIVVRSKSWGSKTNVDKSEVLKDIFYTTDIAPTLIIRDASDNIIEEIQLIVSIEDWTITTYMVHYDNITEDMFPDLNPDDIFHTFEIEVTDKMEGLPLMWFTIDLLQIYPDICLTYDPPETPDIFSIGTDGHSITHIYPYTDANSFLDGTPNEWYIKAYPKDGMFESGRTDLNTTLELEKIELVHASEPSQTPSEIISIVYDNYMCKLSISNNGWSIYTDKEGDPGYDGTTFINIPYAWIPMSAFISNAIDDTDTVLIEAFDVSFKEEYIPFDGNRTNTMSGIHVDAGTDYTNHSVVKDYGVIHNLGEFDGLPGYFKYLLDRKLHRSHVELYSIRDRLGRINTKIYEKQSAGVILDSGIPQSELHKVTDDMPIPIYYSGNRTFKTHHDKVISINNCVSEITYVDPYNFSNSNIVSKKNLQKFVYHGNRTFSTGLMELDPELEYGRVYIISNDPASYSNKATENNMKRAFARICDIPTDYGQLIHVPNIAPTILFDDRYVGSEAGYTDEHANRLWNDLDQKFIVYENSELEKSYIMPSYYNLDSFIGTPVISEKYSTWININTLINFNDLEISIANPGSGYTEGDTLYFMIGGLPIDCHVTSIIETGSVFSYQIDSIVDTIHPSNLDGQETIVKVKNRKSENGKDLAFKITIPTEIMEQLTITRSDIIPEGLHILQYDEYGFIWLYEFDIDRKKWEKHTQLTGEPVTDNRYDYNDNIPQKDRDDVSVLLYNWLNSDNQMIQDAIDNPYDYRFIKNFNVIYPEEYSPETDASEYIKYENMQCSYYTMQETPEYDIGRCTMFTSCLPISDHGISNGIMLPRFHQLNSSVYYDITNKFIVSDKESHQPDLYIFSPYRKYYNKIHDKLNHTKDIRLIDTKKNITFDNVLYVDEDQSTTWIDDRGSVRSNIYRYNPYLVRNIFDVYVREIYQMNKEQIIDMLTLRFGHTNDIINMGLDELRVYAIQNIYTVESNPFYIKEHISKMRSLHEQVIINTDTGEGEQPTGSYMSITCDEVDLSVKVADAKAYAIPMYVFELNYYKDSIPSDYRIFDVDENDITEFSLIICENRNKFIFRNGQWMRVNK